MNLDGFMLSCMQMNPSRSRGLDAAVAEEVRAEIARRRPALTRTEIADQIGARRASLTAKVNGRVPFGPDELDAVAGVLGLSASTFVLRAEAARGLARSAS
ncbi:helix-turn-helix domain-containing protein [Cellulomonas sp. P4]|uniref:helix-turn-helix domain-containing protein n=1 Tax=Cellulomonas sp. P4 TaxID=3142533 RepID=UPI0031BA17BE